MPYIWNKAHTPVPLYNADGSSWGEWSDGSTEVDPYGVPLPVTLPGHGGTQFLAVQFPKGSVVDADGKDVTDPDELVAYVPGAALQSEPGPDVVGSASGSKPAPAKFTPAPASTSTGSSAGTWIAVAGLGALLAWLTRKRGS